MPATDLQGSSTSHSSSPFSAFGRTLLSLRRDAPASASASSAAMPPPPTAAVVDPELEEFHAHVAAHLADLRGGEDDEEEFMSIPWIRRLLEAFLLCQDEFRVALAKARRGATPAAAAERLVAEFGDRAVKALDVCNAARDGVDQARRWERLAAIAASALLPSEDRQGQIHEGQLRRARKALSDLSVLLIDDAAAAGAGAGGGLASFLSSHRNRSFGRARASPSRASSSSSSSSSPSAHFRSLSWSVSRTWSAARQLQAIGAGLAAPRANEAGLAAPAYAMGCLLHLAAWALVAAVPCPDRAAAARRVPLGAAAARAPGAPRRGREAQGPPQLVRPAQGDPRAGEERAEARGGHRRRARASHGRPGGRGAGGRGGPRRGVRRHQGRTGPAGETGPGGLPPHRAQPNGGPRFTHAQCRLSS